MERMHDRTRLCQELQRLDGDSRLSGPERRRPVSRSQLLHHSVLPTRRVRDTHGHLLFRRHPRRRLRWDSGPRHCGDGRAGRPECLELDLHPRGPAFDHRFGVYLLGHQRLSTAQAKVPVRGRERRGSEAPQRRLRRDAGGEHGIPAPGHVSSAPGLEDLGTHGHFPGGFLSDLLLLAVLAHNHQRYGNHHPTWKMFVLPPPPARLCFYVPR